MTNDERERALKLLAIARDPNAPIRSRKSAADEVSRIKAKLTAASKVSPQHAPTASTPAEPSVDPNWIWRKTYQLEMAAIDGRHEDVARLRSEFVAKGLDVPAHKGYVPPIKDVPPTPERPAAPLPLIDERGAALHAVRVRPVRGPVASEQWQDTF
jgi:hypothetical protein